jgi:hypothetical protein
VTDTVGNEGVARALASKARYYLSPGTQPGPRLGGERPVPALWPAQRSTGSVVVTVSSTTALGAYRLLACADGPGTVREANETNNCVASWGTVVVDP